MNEQLSRLLNWLQEIEIGAGDLTTESVAPHAFHVQATLLSKSEGLLCGEQIVNQLLAPVANQLALNWQCHDGEPVQPNTPLVNFIGNGAELLKNRHLIEYIVGRLSGLATATQAAVKHLAKYGKKLTASHRNDPFWETFDREAYLLGGMEIHHRGLEDNIYLTPQHFAYAGAPETVIRRVSEELAEVRKVVKIEVEVDSIPLLQQVNACDCDVIHLVGFGKEDIRYIFEKVNLNRKPVIHLPTLLAFEPTYADYFFRYAVIEELHGKPQFFKTKFVINSQEEL
jgi:nicotinate-nucleotide pyrophosphorylase (carboxylating)